MNLGGILLTLVNQVRVRLDDNTPSEYKHSDVDVVGALNTGEREVARRTYDIEDTTSYISTIVTSTHTYTTSDKIIFIKRMELSYDKSVLNKRDEEWLDDNRATWKTDTGIPTDFVEYKSTYRLTPIPTSTYNGYFLYLTVARLPLYDLSETNLTPEVHSKYYDDMVNYACFILKTKPDIDTIDPDGAMTFYRLFETNVGPRVSGNIERQVKSQPTGMRIQIRR